MTNQYNWKITLSDGSVFEQVNGAVFNLAWEKAGIVNKIEFVSPENDKVFYCDLTNGEFNVDGTVYIPDGVNSEDPKELYYRRRNQVRTDGKNILDAKIKHLFGYKINSKEYVAEVQITNESTTPSNKVADTIVPVTIIPTNKKQL